MNISKQKAALVAGISLLIMTIIAPIANFYAIQGQIVENNAAETVQNIIENETLFRFGIIGLLIVCVLDILIAWGVYILFKSVSKNLSLLTAWFRIVYTAVFIVAIGQLTNVSSLIGGGEYLEALENGQVNSQVMLSINSFLAIWDVAIIFFGFHLILFGVLAFKSQFAPKTLGGLLGIAGLGYLVDGIGRTVSSGYDIEISTFTFLGELAIIFWLLWKGVKGFGKM